MRVGLLQLNASDDPAQNLPQTLEFANQAAAAGAELILTPEVTNCVSTSRSRQTDVLQTEAKDQTLAALRAFAAENARWVLIGSLAVKTDDPDGRFANRSFLIDSKGRIAAHYDKIHMFDVTLPDGETYRESKGYRPGDTAVLAKTPQANIGMTICYDLRFPQLFRTLARAGAQIISVPSAVAPSTGKAHWQSLLQARAIENGAFILAPAQTGTHPSTSKSPRKTYGHSLVVAPWGEILADGGTDPGVIIADLDLSKVADARRMVPSLSGDVEYGLRHVDVPE